MSPLTAMTGPSSFPLTIATTPVFKGISSISMFSLFKISLILFVVSYSSKDNSGFS